MPKRIPSPHRATARPLVEPVTQPLYDADVWSADTTRDSYFFKVPMGQNTVSGDASVAGASVLKTGRHTNMTQSGKLPNPKLFLVKGWRIGINMAPQTTSSHSTVLVGGVLQGHGPHVNDFFHQFIQFFTYFEFWVGGSHRRYAEGPCFMFPMNKGLTPRTSSVSVGQRVGTGSVGAVAEAASYHTWGLYYSAGRNPITIAPEQDFGARISSPLNTFSGTFAHAPPTVVFSGAGLHRLLYVFADGEQAREVQ